LGLAGRRGSVRTQLCSSRCRALPAEASVLARATEAVAPCRPREAAVCDRSARAGRYSGVAAIGPFAAWPLLEASPQ